MINSASTSSGYPACTNCSAAWIAGRSIISMPPGMMPAPMILATHSPASSDEANPTSTARAQSGFLRRRTVISVTTPSSPSEPVMMPRRSYPPASRCLPPTRTTSPVISTSSQPSRLLVVMPYLRQCTPPEFSATLPPMVQAVGEVDLADAVELGHAEKDAVDERQRAARERGAGPARHHLDAFGVAEREHAAHLRRGLGQHDDHGKLAIGGQPIGLVGAHLALGGDHALARHDGAQRRYDALAAGEHGLIRRGHCEGHVRAP